MICFRRLRDNVEKIAYNYQERVDVVVKLLGGGVVPSFQVEGRSGPSSSPLTCAHLRRKTIRTGDVPRKEECHLAQVFEPHP